MHGPKNLNILKNTKTLDFSSREGGEPPLSHHPASQKLLKVFVRQCASIDRKITKLYENPEKPPNPTEMFSIFFGIKRLGPRSTHTISHHPETFFE